MRVIYILFLTLFLTKCTSNPNTSTNNVKYYKAKSECMWKGYKKKSDNFKNCMKLKMSE